LLDVATAAESSAIELFVAAELSRKTWVVATHIRASNKISQYRVDGGDTRAQFERLADVPPEEEWLANITNAKTQRAYKNDVREFIAGL
jgi:hypothetical protein